MPATSGSLGFPCPACKSEYGSMSVEQQKDWTKNTKNRHTVGKTHESYHKKQRIELKSAEVALINVLESEVEEKVVKLYDTPEFTQFVKSIPDRGVRREVIERARGIKDYVKAKKMSSIKEIEDDEKRYVKWDITEELATSSREYQIMKKIQKMTSSTNTLGLYNGKYDQEGGKDRKILVTWNPIKEIKRYRKCGDPLRHIDFKSMLDFGSIVVAKYPKVFSEYFSTKNYPVMNMAFEVVNEYLKQFSNRDWQYLLFEWFWIIRYSEVETYVKTKRMLQGLDGEKGRISIRQIKNRKASTLDFLENFFYYFPKFFAFLSNVLLVIRQDKSLNEEYKKFLNRVSLENNSILDKISMDYLITLSERSEESYINTNIKGIETDNRLNDYLLITRIRPRRIRLYHYKDGIRKRCGPFKLSELPLVALKQLYDDGRLEL